VISTGQLTHRLHRLRVPTTLKEVDRLWLSEALSRNFADLVVRDAQLLDNIGGACTKLRVAVQTNDPHFPRSIIVKGCFEPHTAAMTSLQLREAYAYERVVPRVPDIGSIQALFLGESMDKRAALILEDLDIRGARCMRAIEPIRDFDLACKFVDALAQLHAHWWGSAEIADGGAFDWIPRLSSPDILPAFSLLADPAQTADMLQRPRAAAIPQSLHDAPRLRRAFASMIKMGSAEPMVLGHGDPHLSNLFVDGQGEAGLLDWTCFRAPWALDITYFIGGCLDVEDRRRWELTLVHRYLGCLHHCGIRAPTPEDAWLAYRCWHFWGLLVWLVNSTDYHTESQITAMTTRFAWAAIDHGSLAALES
jgi:hypothetical protein